MGVVYQAEDTRLGRTVALKFLTSPSTLGEESRERFIHEAQAISELDHPNICTVHEFDQTGSREMYIVMAFYGGNPSGIRSSEARRSRRRNRSGNSGSPRAGESSPEGDCFTGTSNLPTS